MAVLSTCTGLGYGLLSRQLNVLSPGTTDIFSPEPVQLQRTVLTGDLRKVPDIEQLDQSRDWPCLNGPRGDGTGLADGLEMNWPEEGPPVAWRVPSGKGYSSPVAFGDRVVLLLRESDEEIVRCLDLINGKTLWDFRYPTNFVCGSNYSSGPYSTPAISDGLVYSIGAEGKLHCLVLENGGHVWSRDLVSEFDVRTRIFGVGHSPSIWRDRVIINVGGSKPDSGILALDKRTGDLLWSATSFGASYATPTIAAPHGRDFAFVLCEEAIVALTPEDGTVLWSMPFKPTVPDGENAATPIVYGDLLMVCSYGTGTRCLQIDEDGMYHPVWESRKQLTSQYISLLCIHGHVFGIHTDFSMRCVELATGKVKWRKKVDAFLRSNQILVGDQIIVMGERGHLGLIDADPKQFQLRFLSKEPVLQVDGFLFQSPALSNGRLLVRSEQELVCFDLRKQ